MPIRSQLNAPEHPPQVVPSIHIPRRTSVSISSGL